MKHIEYILICLAFSFVSSNLIANPKGKELFNSKGCVACHQANADTVGPSLQSMSNAYKGKLGDLINFLKGKGQPKLNEGKFKGQYETVMKIQIDQIKNLPQADLKNLAEFILSH